MRPDPHTFLFKSPQFMCTFPKSVEIHAWNCNMLETVSVMVDMLSLKLFYSCFIWLVWLSLLFVFVQICILIHSYYFGEILFLYISNFFHFCIVLYISINVTGLRFVTVYCQLFRCLLLSYFYTDWLIVIYFHFKSIGFTLCHVNHWFQNITYVYGLFEKL